MEIFREHEILKSRPRKKRTQSTKIGAGDGPASPDSPQAAPVADARAKTEALSGCVLFVDDEPTMRKIVKRILELDGLTVLVAEHGREALEILEKQPVHAVITDVMMPVMDGFQLIREIRCRKLTQAPLFIVSAEVRSNVDLASFMKDHEVSGFLEKPFTRDDMHTALSRFLKKKK